MNSATLTGTGTVLSMHNSVSENFYPLTQWVDTTSIKKVRPTLELRGVSHATNLKVQAAYLAANYPEQGGSPTKLDQGNGFRSGNGYYWGPFEDIATALENKVIVQFGVVVSQQNTNDGIQGCQATLRIEIQSP